MWKTTNYKGESVVWYSEEEHEALKKIITELEYKLKELEIFEENNNRR